MSDHGLRGKEVEVLEMKYRVEHSEGIDIVEADDYHSESLGIANVVTFLARGELVKRFLHVKKVERLDKDEKDKS